MSGRLDEIRERLGGKSWSETSKDIGWLLGEVERLQADCHDAKVDAVHWHEQAEKAEAEASELRETFEQRVESVRGRALRRARDAEAERDFERKRCADLARTADFYLAEVERLRGGRFDPDDMTVGQLRERAEMQDQEEAGP